MLPGIENEKELYQNQPIARQLRRTTEGRSYRVLQVSDSNVANKLFSFTCLRRLSSIGVRPLTPVGA